MSKKSKRGGGTDGHGNTYDSRNAILKSLGYSSYPEYLQSSLWRKIRSRVYCKRGRTCWLCPNKAEQVHHCSYSRASLLGKKLRHLFPVCKECHEKVEFDGQRKRDVWQAAEHFHLLRSRNPNRNTGNRHQDKWTRKSTIGPLPQEEIDQFRRERKQKSIRRKWAKALRRGVWLDPQTGEPTVKVPGRIGTVRVTLAKAKILHPHLFPT